MNGLPFNIINIIYKNMDHIEQIVYKGYTINIYNDSEYARSPREWSNNGIMVCFHGRYNLGDDYNVHEVDNDDCQSWADVRNKITKRHGNSVILPLFLYDHGGITMNTTGFGCGWDSGQVGFIFMPYSKIREVYGKKRISRKTIKQVEKDLTREVKEYDYYITGEVYRYQIIDDKGNEIDSCCGFYGDYEDYLIKEAKRYIDITIKEKEKEREELRKEAYRMAMID